MTEIKPCPFCNYPHSGAYGRSSSRFRMCLNVTCRAEGPCCDTEAQAIAAWNAAPRPSALASTSPAPRAPGPVDRDTLGRFVREAWVRWALAQPHPKPSWLVPYDDLSEADKEADRQIGEAIVRWTLAHEDAARAFVAPVPLDEHKRAVEEAYREGLFSQWIGEQERDTLLSLFLARLQEKDAGDER
jgi:hypothetical protein